MAKQTVGLGSSANDGTGDTLRSGGTKVNANFDEIYAEFGDGTTLSNGNTSGHILVANGTKFGNVAASGDISIANTGVVAVTDVSLTTNTLGGTAGVGGFEIPQGSAPSTTTNKLYNVSNTLYWHGTAVGVAGGSAISAFNVTGDSGTVQSIADGNTITIAGGTGIASVASATDTITLNIDSTVATLVGTQILTNKTLTSPIISGLSLSDASVIFEGATANAYETTITVTDPTADRTWTIPDASDTFVGKATTDTLTSKTLTSPIVSGLSLSDASIIFEGATANAYETTLTVTDPTADRIITFPNTTGTVALTSDITFTASSTDALTNKTLTQPKFADAGFIADANGLEQIIFQTTASAVNEIEVTNSATGGSAIVATSTAPIIGASGEANVDLALLPKGTGYVTVRSTTGTNNQGAIRLNCENNTHGQTLMSQPHSAADSSYFMLPKGSSVGNARTTPDVIMSADKAVGTVQALADAGAVSVDTLITELTTTTGSALTLANGVAGQMKIITMVVASGTATLTPTTFSDGTSLAFDAAGESVVLVFHNTIGWKAVVNNGATLA